MEEEQLIVLAVSSAGTCFLLVLSRDTSQKDAMFGVWTAMSELICQEKINMKSLLYPRSLQTIYRRTHGILKSDLKLLSFCGSMLFLSWHSFMSSFITSHTYLLQHPLQVCAASAWVRRPHLVQGNHGPLRLLLLSQSCCNHHIL